MPLVIDMQQISLSVWALFQDSSGKVLDEYSVRKWTFHEGICPEARADVWRFLLGYYPFLSTMAEREQIDRDKRREYERLLDSWQCGIIPDWLAEYIRVIGKDCVRTDRAHSSFSGSGPVASENIGTLNRILTTYCVYNQELGYVQGMNEFLAPLLLVLNNEHQAFWCLTEVLRRMTGVFSDLTLSQPLSSVARLCYYADTQLHNHIKSIHGDDEWMFCYRGVLLNFKREFSMEDVFSLWEIVWCDHLTKHFQLFVAVAILVHYKQEILQCKSIEALMQFAMGLSLNAPLSPILTIARALAEQLKGEEYCPYELRYLVSDEGCAPPPLVGFVRTRQKFSTLYSNKISRSYIWRSLFGDQPITSPLMLSPTSHMPTSPNATHQLRVGVPSSSSSPQSPTSRFRTLSLNGSQNGHHNSLLTNTLSPTGNSLTSAGDSNAPIQLITNGGTSSENIGPPPKLGFVPQSLFIKNNQRVAVRYQPGEGHTSGVRTHLLNGIDSLESAGANNQSITQMPHSDPPYLTSTHADTSNGSSSTNAPFPTLNLNPSPPNTRLQDHYSNQASYQGVGSHASSLQGSPMYPPSYNHLSYATTTNTHSPIHRPESLLASTSTQPSSKDSTDVASSTSEGVKPCNSAVHYDHRNGRLSGSVFDERSVAGQELHSEIEFDHLRSEPSLLI